MPMVFMVLHCSTWSFWRPRPSAWRSQQCVGRPPRPRRLLWTPKIAPGPGRLFQALGHADRGLLLGPVAAGVPGLVEDGVHAPRPASGPLRAKPELPIVRARNRSLNVVRGVAVS